MKTVEQVTNLLHAFSEERRAREKLTNENGLTRQ
jgi:hypothetical protein